LTFPREEGHVLEISSENVSARLRID